MKKRKLKPREPRPDKTPFVLRASDHQHLSSMPLKMSEPLRLVHSGNSYVKVANGLRLPLGTVKVRVHRARRRVLELRGENHGA